MKKKIHRAKFLFLIYFTFSLSTATVSVAQTWRLIQPSYPTVDAFVAGFSVADYGATGDGVTDVTSIFQGRLDALGTLNGGTLFVPQGKYVIKGTLLVPKGVTIRGEWKKPVKGEAIVGTILMAYSGRGSETGAAFITMQPASAVMDLSIWYPEQLPSSITPYPPAILFGQTGYWGNDFCNVKNVTFVNAYSGAIFSRDNGGASPIINGLYGTPLSRGVEIDNIADVGRVEWVDFSPAYWAGSGLPNSPSTGGPHESFINLNGTAIVMRRNDWSYATYINAEGYKIGFHATLTATAGSNSTPNGHNYAFTFTNCQTGVFVEYDNEVGIMFSKVNLVNCKTGIQVGANTSGAIQFHTSTIDATTAINVADGSTSRFMFVQSKVNRGQVNVQGSTFLASDCDFNNTAPQIVLGKNSRAAITGNRFKNAVQIQNSSLYLCSIDHTALSLKKAPVFPDGIPETHKPTRLGFYNVKSAPYNAQDDGTTDNTTAIQNALNQAAADGGGIVFLPPGKYKVSGNLTVPTNVELKGASDLSSVPMGQGSVLEAYAGRGNATGTPFLKLSSGSGLRGVVIDYPEQLYTSLPSMTAYPYAIQATGSSVYIVNVGLRATYKGVDLFTYQCDNHYVEYLTGHVFNNGIKVGGGSINGKIYNTQFNTIVYASGGESKFGSWSNSPPQGSNTTPAYDYNYANLDFLILGNCQNEILYNDFSFGVHKGISMISENGISPTGLSMGYAVDGSRIGMSFESVGAAGFDFVNTQVVAYGDTTTRYIEVLPTFNSKVTFFNSDYWGNPGKGVVLNGGSLDLQSANFRHPGQLRYATLASGTLNVHNSAIWSTSKLLNAGGEPRLITQSSVIDSSGISKSKVALWKNNLGNVWAVSIAGAMSRTGWTATACTNTAAAQNGLDGNVLTRWDTQGSQTPGQCYTVDMKASKTFDRIVLDASNSPDDSPAGYSVSVSNDGTNWSSEIASGIGATGMTVITFAQQTARYIKVTQTGTKGNYWSIHEFYVFGPIAVTGVTLSPATASINVGATQQLTASISPSNATNQTVTWSSGNTAVATVNSNGLVTGVSTGTTTIIVTTQDGSKTATSTITVNALSATPYLGTPWPIPGTIEAENYDDGGEGIAYHDNEALNQGGKQRTDQGVDVETTGDATGTYNVGWTSTGEWLKYTVNVATTGTYTLQLRVASPNTGKSLHVEIDGTTIATIAIPNTTNWQIYQTTANVTTPSITAGQHILRIYMDTDGFNLNYVSFTLNAPPVISSVATATGTVGVSFTYNITATNTPTSYGATGLPAGLSVNASTGLISGMPTTAGTYISTISAANAGGTGTKSVTITINPAAPVINSAATASGTVGAAFSYNIIASNAPASYGATGLPAGLSIAASTGLISGMPTTAGTYTSTVSATNAGGTGTKTLTITISNPTGSTPYLGTPWAIPGTIQAENYDDGGEGVAYHDNDAINSGGQQRTNQGVDVENTGDATGTYNVGWTNSGEWMKYTVNVGTTGTYSLQVRVASPNSGKSLHVEIDGATIATIAIPNTTNWQTYQTVTVTTSSITAGQHILRIYMDTDGFNLNYLTFVSTAAKPAITSSTTSTATLGVAYSYTITATNSPTSYAATGLPAGLSINTSNGVISGTPTISGTTNVTITASNASGTGSATLVLTVSSATDPAGVITCYKSSSAITVNGNLSEAGWNVTRQFSKTVLGTANNTATFGVMWDNTNLYIGVKVLDANLFSDSPDWWEDDAVEVYIDANYNKLSTYDGFDNQIIKGYNKTGVSTKFNITGLQHAVAAIAGGYTVELAIPWSQLGISAPAAGTNIGFDISYDDDDNGGSREGQAVWNGTIDDWQNTSAFGRLTLNSGVASRIDEEEVSTTEDNSVSIYPNPVTGGILTAVLPIGWTETAEVFIINATGEVVKRNVEDISDNQIQLNLSALQPGIYFIQIVNAGNVVTEKFIVK